MNLWYNFWGHLRTILHHKNLVRHYCFRAGLYKQGIMHDWSKYSPVEFIVSAISKAVKRVQTLVKKQQRDILLHGFITKDVIVTILNTGSTSL